MNGLDLVGAAIGLIPMILSLSVHEWAHAWAADRLGDDTAVREGRLTLNPAAHIDPFGTIILPLLLALKGIPGFGWARPVPINPVRFRRGVSMWGGMAITASAGPLSNLALAVLGTVLLGLLTRFDAIGAAPQHLLEMAIVLNVMLAIFNMIPVPPLDGSRIVAWLVPTRHQPTWLLVERFAPILLIVIFMAGGRIIHGPVNVVVGLLNRLLVVIA